MGEAELNKNRLALALEAAGLDLWENNLLTGEVTLKAVKTLTELGYSAHEMVAYVDEIYQLFHPDDVATVRAAVDDHLSGRTPQYRCEFRLRAKNGTWVWYANYGKVMDDDSATPGKRFVGVTFNIDDRKRKEDEIAQINQQLAERNALLQSYNNALELLASCDPLTGLANRRRL
ncbi:MAG TPA: PAS domain-containing protein, partial [Rhodoferax sp.]